MKTAYPPGRAIFYTKKIQKLSTCTFSSAHVYLAFTGAKIVN
jgi:hypothetical protein